MLLPHSNMYRYDVEFGYIHNSLLHSTPELNRNLSKFSYYFSMQHDSYCNYYYSIIQYDAASNKKLERKLCPKLTSIDLFNEKKMVVCVIDVRVGFTLQIKRQVFLDGYASNLRVSYPEHLTALASLFAGSIEFTMSVSPPLMSLFSAVSYFGTLVLVHEKQLIIFFCLDSCFSSTRFSRISIC